MSANMINLGMHEDVVKPILEKQIQAAIHAIIGNPEELIQKVVSAALSQKVDSDGRVSRYSGDKKYGYLDVLTRKSIQKVAEEALRDWLEENAQLVKEAVIKELNKPARQRSIAIAFAGAVESSLWRIFNVIIDNRDVSFIKRDDD
jgi:hypothetical protein